MTRKTSLTVASVLSLILAAGAVHAQAPQAPQPLSHKGPQFEAFDFNKDGKLTIEDFTAASAARQKAMDPNGDGVITLDEMKAFAGEEAKRRAEERAERRFKALDTDGDGRVTAAELMAAKEGRPGKGPKGPHGFGPGAHDPSQINPQMAERLIQMADENKDGAVSPEEFEAAMQKMAEKMREHKGPKGPKGPEGKPGHKPGDHKHEGKPEGHDAPKP